MKKNNNIFYVPFKSVRHLENAASDIVDQVSNAIEEIPFKKISIPIYANKSTLGILEEAEKDSNLTIGYIKDYNVEKGEFKVFIFDKFTSKVRSIINKAEIDITYGIYKGNLTTIIKINIAVFDENETEAEE